jgi:hypothetical protein
MNRRAFLRSLGLTGAGVGLGAIGVRSPLARASSEAPKRLLVISHCHGWPYDGWALRPGLELSTPWELDLASTAVEEFSAPLAALFEHRSKMIAVDGLSLATAELDVEGNRHDKGWIHAWTGNNANFSGSDTRSTSASIDQLVAQHIARPDRIPSLELSIDGGLEPARPISYGPNGVQVPRLNTADLAWQRLFGPSLGDASLAVRQRGVLDFAYGEFQARRSSYGSSILSRLEAHFDLLSGLGDRIEGMAALTCPESPTLTTTFAGYDAQFDAYSDLITAAFSCDITRVVSLSLAEMPTADFGADHITDDVHKGLAHEIYNDPAKHEAMVNFLTAQSGQVARLISSLAAMPDVDGGSVLDNTLVVWGSELANGWHGYLDYCPVLFGGSWAFPTGRYLHLPRETPVEILVPSSVAPSGYTARCGKPVQHLLVSVAQAMGVDVDHVGLQWVQGQSGEMVLLDGPLTELTETIR